MSKTVSLQIKERNSLDKTVTTTIQYVNPEAKGSVLLDFSKRLSALTNGFYRGTVRIEKRELDLEDPEAENNG